MIVVEWGERLPAAWRQDALRIANEMDGTARRRFKVEAEGERARALLAAWSGS